MKKILIITIFSLALALNAGAQTTGIAKSKDPCKSGDFCLNVPIGGLTGFRITNSSENIMGKYIEVWYNLLLGTIGIIATIMIMWGGMKWLVSRGDKGEITSAQNTITSAITGLILAFGSFAILNLINPALLTIRMPSLPIIDAGKDAMNNETNLHENDGSTKPATALTATNVAKSAIWKKKDGTPLDGTTRMVASMDSLLQGMQDKGELPEGFRITSCLDTKRTNVNSLHISGNACDVTWDGINSQSAQRFVDNLRVISPELSTLIEYNNDSRFTGAHWPQQTSRNEPGGIHIELGSGIRHLTGQPAGN